MTPATLPGWELRSRSVEVRESGEPVEAGGVLFRRDGFPVTGVPLAIAAQGVQVEVMVSKVEGADSTHRMSGNCDGKQEWNPFYYLSVGQIQIIPDDNNVKSDHVLFPHNPLIDPSPTSLVLPVVDGRLL